MCIAPISLPSGQLVGCRNCWQCLAIKVDDWVGRNIAESKTTKAYSVTLTYGERDGAKDHIRAALLTYSDVQKFFKLLRSDGFNVRYFVVGEYGSEKARAHWHMMLYFKGKVPDHVLNERFQQKHWSHGFSFWEKPTHRSIRYICKYITKGVDFEGQQSKINPSKKPPLGFDYFTKKLALYYAKAGFAPRSYHYTFDGVVNEKNQKIKFMMRGKIRDEFMSAFVSHWQRIHGDRHLPYSEILEDYLSSLVEPDLSIKGNIYQPRQEKPPSIFKPYSFSEKHNAYVKEFYGVKHYWAENQKGYYQWQEKIGEETPTLEQARRGKINLYREAKS